MTSEDGPRYAALAPIAVALLAHVAALAGGFTNWDDPLYLLQNPLTVHPLRGGLEQLLLTPDIDYAIPVTVLGYAAQRAIFGLDPLYFHLVSLLMHAGIAGLCYALCRRLGIARLAAAAGACFFAAHPVTVEPVAWVVGQKDLWATGLLLAAVYVRAGGVSPRRTLAVLVLGVLALGAKPSAVVVPVLIVAVDLFMRRDPRKAPSVLLYSILCTAAAMTVWVAVVGHSDLEQPASFGASSLANAGWAATLQLHHLIAPGGLAAAYYPPDGVAYAVLVVVGLALIAVIIGGTWALARRGQRAVAFSLVAAIVAYAPASGLVQIGRGPADSYLYAPLAFLATAVGVGVQQLWARGRRPVRGALAAVLVIFALVSAARTQVWAGPEALWSDVVEEFPDQPMAHRRYGNALQYNGKLEEALEVFSATHERWPEHAPTTLDYALTFDALGRQSEAEVMFARAALDGGSAFFRNYYATYVVTHPRVEISDPEVAEKAIAEKVPAWIAERAPTPMLLRAADLLELGGRHGELVGALREAASR